MQEISTIIYLSQADSALKYEDIKSILETSRSYNSANDVSGVLFYLGGKFMQVLEGKRNVISALFEKIQTDGRHHSVTLLLNMDLPERNFAQWSMGFIDKQTDGVSGQLDFWHPSDLLAEIKKKKSWSPAFEFIKMFYRTNMEIEEN